MLERELQDSDEAPLMSRDGRLRVMDTGPERLLIPRPTPRQRVPYVEEELPDAPATPTPTPTPTPPATPTGTPTPTATATPTGTAPSTPSQTEPQPDPDPAPLWNPDWL